MKKIQLTPIKLPFSFRDSVLATGTELKSSFAVLDGDTVFMSRAYDDLREPKTFEDFRRDIGGLKNSSRIIACDLHPEYISTKYAKEVSGKTRKNRKKTSLLEIQHHHAHIASCMAENRLRAKVIGVAFDGTGYGPDGNIWGGEFLIADYRDFDRAAHLAYVPMPGADRAVLEPIRMAFSYLYRTYGRNISKSKSGVLKRLGRHKYSLLAEMIDKDINSPLTSSCGRLFDAVSSLIGVRDYISYEGEAAIELERIATADSDDIYTFEIRRSHDGMTIEFWPVIKAMISDLKKKRPAGLISRKFHNSLAEAIKEICVKLRKKTKLNDVVLSGGVFQNRILSQEAKKRLENAKFSVYTHSRISCADSGLSLGQAVIAAYRGSKCA